MNAVGSGVWLCRRWARLYTRNLPTAAAADRRDELESDLWEHGNDVALHSTGHRRYQLEVVVRVLLGAPADIAWRRAVRAQSQSLRKGVIMNGYIRRHSHDFAIALAALGVMPGMSLLVLLGSAGDSDSRNELYWVLSALALSAVLLSGVIVRAKKTRPRIGTALLVVGAPAPAVAWFWFPPLYLLSLAILVAALLSAPRRPSNIPAPI